MKRTKAKKIINVLIFPHTAVAIALLPLSAVLLVYSFLNFDSSSVFSAISYAVSAYALTVWCFRIPRIIRFFKSFKRENKYARLWLTDARLRVNITLTASFLWNTGYSLFQLGLGIYHGSAWFYSLAAYYFLLALMRFFLVRHSTKNQPGEKLREELSRYRICGYLFIVMTLALSVMTFYILYRDKAVKHHEVTTIAMAAYTFFTFTMAIVGIIRYRKYESPVFSAAKAISLVAASVSMLTLESTMLVTFSDGSMTELTQKQFIGISGAAIFVFIIAMAIYMIVQSTKKNKGAELSPKGSDKRIWKTTTALNTPTRQASRKK